MKQGIDDFDLISVEEYYEASRMQWVTCDHCRELSPISDLHIMQSFHSSVDILLCQNCYRKLHQ